MLLQISKYSSKSLRVDVSKLKKKSSLLFENTTVEKTKIKANVLLWTKVTFYRAGASWYTIEIWKVKGRSYYYLSWKYSHKSPFHLPQFFFQAMCSWNYCLFLEYSLDGWSLVPECFFEFRKLPKFGCRRLWSRA